MLSAISSLILIAGYYNLMEEAATYLKKKFNGKEEGK